MSDLSMGFLFGLFLASSVWVAANWFQTLWAVLVYVGAAFGVLGILSLEAGRRG